MRGADPGDEGAPATSTPLPRSSSASRSSRASWASWACGAAALLFAAGRCLVPMDETDLFYNLRLGELILSTGTVPRTNLLSYTFPDFPDPNLAWLFQVPLALVYRAGGIAGTVLFKTALVLIACGILYRVALRRRAHPAFAALALALGAWAAEPRFVERPHLVTFVGLALLLLALERAERRARGTRPWLLWAMVPVGILWANANSCFFLAPVVLLLYAAGGALDARFGARSDADERLRDVPWIAVALIPVAFATPSGWRWLPYVANHFRMPWLRPLQEYRRVEWPLDGPYVFVVVAVAALGAATLARGRGRTPEEPSAPNDGPRSPWPWRHALPILALGLLGAFRVRFVAEFALLATPFLATGASRLLRTWHPGPTIQRALPAATTLLLTTLALAPRLAAARAGQPVFDLGIEAGLVPFDDIRWLDAQGLRPRLYNDLEVGSYLAWDGWPRARVFQDPRINGYPAGFHAVLRRADLPRATWQSLMDRFDVRAALISFPAENPRAALFDPARWALVRRSRDALVFARRTPDHAALIAREELPLTFRFVAGEGTAAEWLDAPPDPRAVPRCEWSRRLADGLATVPARRAEALADYRAALTDPGCLAPPMRARAREDAGALALALDDPSGAVTLLDGLPSMPARTNLGFALLRLQRFEAARVSFDTVLNDVRADASGAGVREADDHVWANALFGRALTAESLGATDRAEADLRLFLRRWPRHAAAPEAQAHLKRLVARRPTEAPRTAD